MLYTLYWYCFHTLCFIMTCTLYTIQYWSTLNETSTCKYYLTGKTYQHWGKLHWNSCNQMKPITFHSVYNTGQTAILWLFVFFRHWHVHICPFICSSVYPPWIFSSIHQSICASAIHIFIYLSIHSSIHSSIHLSIHLFIYLFIYLSIYPSIIHSFLHHESSYSLVFIPHYV